jgi:hypothetical protein
MVWKSDLLEFMPFRRLKMRVATMSQEYAEGPGFGSGSCSLHADGWISAICMSLITFAWIIDLCDDPLEHEGV